MCCWLWSSSSSSPVGYICSFSSHPFQLPFITPFFFSPFRFLFSFLFIFSLGRPLSPAPSLGPFFQQPNNNNNNPKRKKISSSLSKTEAERRENPSSEIHKILQ
jgi:hypothetical protein